MVARMRGVGLRRAAASLAIAAGAALGITVACGPGDLSDLTAGRPDAGVEAGIDSSVCVHASVPVRPTTPDGPNTASLVFAFDAVRFDTDEQDGGLPKPLGLDLDTTCTCDDPKLEPESCVPPDAGLKRPCDGPDGRDNAAGPLLSAASVAGKGAGPAAFQKKIESGTFNVLMTLDGWNGLPDDPSVLVGMQLSNGIEGTQSDAGAPRPRFDGTDVWTVSPTSVLGGVELAGTDCRLKPATCIPVRVDTSAYVKDGTIVAHLDLLDTARVVDRRVPDRVPRRHDESEDRQGRRQVSRDRRDLRSLADPALARVAGAAPESARVGTSPLRNGLGPRDLRDREEGRVRGRRSRREPRRGSHVGALRRHQQRHLVYRRHGSRGHDLPARG